jgi:hypothetical protein
VLNSVAYYSRGILGRRRLPSIKASEKEIGHRPAGGVR